MNSSLDSLTENQLLKRIEFLKKELCISENYYENKKKSEKNDYK